MKYTAKKYQVGFVMNKLYGRICEKYGTIGCFAENVARSAQYVSSVLKGKRYLDCDEAENWRELLDIEVEDFRDIFLEHILTK